MEQRVKLKTLITRINRHLSKDQSRLCKSRPYEVRTLGAYYIMTTGRMIGRCRIEPVDFAVEHGLLKPDEVVVAREPPTAPPAVACRWPRGGREPSAPS